MPGRDPLASAHGGALARHSCRSSLGKHVLAAAARLGGGGDSPGYPHDPDRGTRRLGQDRSGRIALGCDIHPNKKGGPDVGKTKVGKGMKLQIVADASGLPLGLAVAGANVSEQKLLKPALDDAPVEVPPGTPVVADKGHDSDTLRDEIEEAGLTPVIPHRANR